MAKVKWYKKIKKIAPSLFLITGTLASIFAAWYAPYALKSYNAAIKSLEIQKMQLEKPFFIYSFNQDLKRIEVKHSDNMSISEIGWVFPASTTSYAVSDDGSQISSTPAGPGKIYPKYDNSLYLNEVFRSYQEELLNSSDVKNNPTENLGLYSFDFDDNAYSYLRCQIFPTIQNIDDKLPVPQGVLVGAEVYYERIDGTTGVIIDMLLIRETQNKSPQIRVIRNVSQKMLMDSLKIMKNRFYGTVKSIPFSKDKKYLDNKGECSEKSWGYIILPPEK